MDLSKLRDICATGGGIDDQLLAQLLAMFLADNRQRVEELQSAAMTGQLEQVRRLAHTISGSAGTAGAAHLAQLARTIEADAWSGQLPLPAALGALQQEFSRVEAAVLTSYPSLDPTA